MLKTLAEFRRGHPERGRQTEVGYVQISDFRPISRYIPKTVDGGYYGTLIGSRMRSIEWHYFQ